MITDTTTTAQQLDTDTDLAWLEEVADYSRTQTHEAIDQMIEDMADEADEAAWLERCEELAYSIEDHDQPCWYK
jgi:hypothetical protein